MIALRQVSKSYGSGRNSTVALPEVSLDGGPGEFIWISGLSGAGKSTLLGIAGLLIRPDAGEVWVDGIQMDHASDRIRTSTRQGLVGFVPQSPRLFPELSASQNVALAMKRADPRRALKSLARVGLEDRADSLVRTLSGGQQQRVSVARALASNPKIILADEPSSGLDDAAAASMFEVLRDLANESRCVIVASHDARIRSFVDRTISLNTVVVS